MKLSKQERIGAVIITVIVIILVGIFVFIKPRFEAIGTARMSYENKQAELTAAQEKAATKNDLRESVYDAYEDGMHLADTFFTEMNTYQADEGFRNFLSQCKANVIIESLDISTPTSETLAPEYYTYEEVTYALKTYATGNLEPTEEELAAAKREETLRSALGEGQEVGAITVRFDVTALDQDELIKFCDEVNNYCKTEEGKSVRKACKLNGFVFNYPLVDTAYDELIKEIAEKAKEDGTKALYDHFKLPVPVDRNNTNTNTGTAGEEDEKEKELGVSDYIYTVGTSITFYSVPRMQDPTDQLDAQDGVAV